MGCGRYRHRSRRLHWSSCWIAWGRNNWLVGRRRFCGSFLEAGCNGCFDSALHVTVVRANVVVVPAQSSVTVAIIHQCCKRGRDIGTTTLFTHPHVAGAHDGFVPLFDAHIVPFVFGPGILLHHGNIQVAIYMLQQSGVHAVGIAKGLDKGYLLRSQISPIVQVVVGSCQVSRSSIRLNVGLGKCDGSLQCCGRKRILVKCRCKTWNVHPRIPICQVNDFRGVLWELFCHPCLVMVVHHR